MTQREIEILFRQHYAQMTRLAGTLLFLQTGTHSDLFSKKYKK
jgi:hypothetical protein